MNPFSDADIFFRGTVASSGVEKLFLKYPEKIVKRFPASYREEIAKRIREAKGEKDIPFPEDSGNILYRISFSEESFNSALFRLAKETGTGFRVDLRRVPVFQEFLEVAILFDLNPYELRMHRGEILLAPSGTETDATKIGVMQKKKAKEILRGDEIQFLNRPKDPLKDMK